MRVDVRFRGVDVSSAFREYALRRIHYQLSRFGDELASVVVRLSDTNGPKGGIDKLCKVTVKGRRIGSLTISELTGDAYSASDLAIGRIARAVGRNVERVNSQKSFATTRRAS